MRKRLELLDLLRFLAILLVIHSHLDELYPIPALATGGAAGNGLFFIIGGYCWRMQPGFFRHMGRRFARLYPGVFLSLLVQIACGLKAVQGVAGFVQDFIWPTAFWFVGAIILFDGLMWVLEKRKDLGFYVQKKGVPYFAIGKQKKWVFLSFFLFLMPIALKALMVKWPVLMPLQGLTQFMVIGFAYAGLLLTLTGEETYRAKVPKKLRKGISAGAVLSLEMYLVQFPVISLCKALPFPINVGAVLVATTCLAFFLNRADQAVYHWLDRYIKKT